MKLKVTPLEARRLKKLWYFWSVLRLDYVIKMNKLSDIDIQLVSLPRYDILISPVEPVLGRGRSESILQNRFSLIEVLTVQVYDLERNGKVKI